MRRYTLHRYDRLTFAVDCEDCDRKVTNLTPNKTGGEVLDLLDAHEQRFHSRGAAHDDRAVTVRPPKINERE